MAGKEIIQMRSRELRRLKIIHDAEATPTVERAERMFGRDGANGWITT
jgi:hypothetical protein